MSDLERSVDRRERIIQQADLNLKRDNVNPKHTKLNIQRNFAQIKERNRLLLKVTKLFRFENIGVVSKSLGFSLEK
jgi:hypothetical protein